jgi:transposase
MKTYSLDLRERVVAAADVGEVPRRTLAELFGVSYGWVKKLLRQRRKLGHVQPLAHGGGHPALLDEKKRVTLRAEIKRHPDATLEELCRKVLGREGTPVSVPTMSRVLAEMGLSRKKEGHLSR